MREEIETIIEISKQNIDENSKKELISKILGAYKIKIEMQFKKLKQEIQDGSTK